MKKEINMTERKTEHQEKEDYLKEKLIEIINKIEDYTKNKLITMEKPSIKKSELNIPITL